ncbi:class I SAM-dependent methyltransferase [Streptomyces sp. NPDC016309]|uniref:class I SAM-dependent methyltransferase n=1 Tax=Streptomyces sp. NPDC016309 TaxID=3364965 RepID=UPI0037030A8A
MTRPGRYAGRDDDRDDAGRRDGGPPPPGRDHRHNADADWDQWPVAAYLAENYRRMHASDATVIRHHAGFYRQFPADGIGRSLEFGAGPNLYPLMVGAAVARRIDALEPSAANVAYLTGQLAHPDENWDAFYALCRTLDPRLPASLPDALSRVGVLHADATAVPPGAYDLASMNFVAESVTEDADEFAALCGTFIHAVRPGGHLVAAFMENMPSYHIGAGLSWPAFPVDTTAVRHVFAPYTERLRITRVEKDPTLPDYGDTGMVLLRAVRTPVDG